MYLSVSELPRSADEHKVRSSKVLFPGLANHEGNIAEYLGEADSNEGILLFPDLHN